MIRRKAKKNGREREGIGYEIRWKLHKESPKRRPFAINQRNFFRWKKHQLCVTEALFVVCNPKEPYSQVILYFSENVPVSKYLKFDKCRIKIIKLQIDQDFSSHFAELWRQLSSTQRKRSVNFSHQETHSNRRCPDYVYCEVVEDNRRRWFHFIKVSLQKTSRYRTRLLSTRKTSEMFIIHLLRQTIFGESRDNLI